MNMGCGAIKEDFSQTSRVGGDLRRCVGAFTYARGHYKKAEVLMMTR